MGKNFMIKKYNYTGDGILNFYKNRALQIFPVYYFCVFIVAIFNYQNIFELNNIKELIRILTFTNDGWLNVNINEALWSLSTEIQFYILAPFLILIVKFLVDLFGLRIVSFLFIVFGILERFVLYKITGGEIDLGIWDRYIYKPFCVNIDLFLFGILANFCIDKLSRINLKLKNIEIIIFSVFALLLLPNFFIGYYTFHTLNSTFAKIFIYILPSYTAIMTFVLIVLIEWKDIFYKIKNNKNLFHYFGILTFVVYVWHEPVLYKVRLLVNNHNLSIAQELLIGLLFCLFYGALSYFLIEKPIGIYKKR